MLNEHHSSCIYQVSQKFRTIFEASYLQNWNTRWEIWNILGKKKKLWKLFWYQTRPLLRHICTLIQCIHWFSRITHTTKLTSWSVGVESYHNCCSTVSAELISRFSALDVLKHSRKEQTLLLLILATQYKKWYPNFIKSRVHSSKPGNQKDHWTLQKEGDPLMNVFLNFCSTKSVWMLKTLLWMCSIFA